MKPNPIQQPSDFDPAPPWMHQITRWLDKIMLGKTIMKKPEELGDIVKESTIKQRYEMDFKLFDGTVKPIGSIAPISQNPDDPIPDALCGNWQVIGHNPDGSMKLCRYILPQNQKHPNIGVFLPSSDTLMAENYERKNGSVALLKKTMSSLTHLLVEKGVCTESELLESFKRELKQPNIRS
jgi:hypothetical protein